MVLQSCRGTGGSGGDLHLWRNEAAAGQATTVWLRRPPWFLGVLWGPLVSVTSAASSRRSPWTRPLSCAR
ncbi:CocE/NonD family hydrolase [Streptomyces sp. NPDC012825]|uniref:CocE/NonD family hydrolase n=1 Tax=Streptomyces sp. NPDC012825 TaxID=3364851 RepID=UPI0036C3D9E0